jgi:two-component system, cell cycle sensor histidine kinase PleC
MSSTPEASAGRPAGGVGSAREPAFVLDADAGAILAANRAGWQVWGLDAPHACPVWIDRAMPALHCLRDLASAGGTASDLEQRLTFWTARGIVAPKCFVSGPQSAHCARFAVRLSEPAPSSSMGNRSSEAVEQAKLAHEIRTPLSAVISYAEVLKDEHFGPLGNTCYRTYAANIFESARHVLRLVDAMLQGFLDRSRGARLTFTNVASDSVIESCLVLARPIAERAGVELVASLPPNPPHIIADELSLKQILLNLLANAIKFSRHGERVRVSVQHPASGDLHISVADTGPGMRQLACAVNAHAAALTQGSALNAGLGFGLPLARALADANGASLKIESEPGRGTCVTITFGKDRVVPV